MLEGIDYSHARPGGTAIAAAGKHFVVRYLYPNPDGTGKGLTNAEVHDLQAHGLAVALVYEGSAGDMRKGHTQGAADAKLAQAQLAALTGLPHTLPIYFAKDYDGGLTAAEIAYLAGAASVIGASRVGLYGGYQAIADGISGKHAAWFWQTYAWSAGRVHAGIHLLQYSNGQKLNGSVDLVRALTTEYGQHTPGLPTPVSAPPPAPHPAVTPTLEEDPVPIYFKGDASPNVYVLNPVTGTKRHISHPEYNIVVTGGKHEVIHVAQTDADAIPTA